jgi:hypothetical protein
MKKIIFSIIIIFVGQLANAQIQTPVKKTAPTNQPVNGINQKILNQTATRSSTGTGLPDLKFTAFNVSAVLSSGTSVYTLNITCTVKNDGTASVLTDDVSLQGFTTDLDWVQKSQDVGFTNHFKPAGGRTLSDIPKRGEELAPGSSKQISYSMFNVLLSKEQKPAYLIGINLFSTLPEISIENNKTYMSIFL